MENTLVGTVEFVMLNHLMKNWNTVNNQDLLTLMTVNHVDSNLDELDRINRLNQIHYAFETALEDKTVQTEAQPKTIWPV